MAAPDEEFRVKSLTWHGRDTYMLMQGDNGPCPLLALCNVLLLRNSIALPRPGAPNVAQSELTALLAEYILDLGRMVVVDGRQVQAVPKGGWWHRAPSWFTEHDLRIVRAILGVYYDAPRTAREWQRAVVYGPFDARTAVRRGAPRGDCLPPAVVGPAQRAPHDAPQEGAPH